MCLRPFGGLTAYPLSAVPTIAEQQRRVTGGHGADCSGQRLGRLIVHGKPETPALNAWYAQWSRSNAAQLRLPVELDERGRASAGFSAGRRVQAPGKPPGGAVTVRQVPPDHSGFGP
jgi:hypothetical protein